MNEDLVNMKKIAIGQKCFAFGFVCGGIFLRTGNIFRLRLLAELRVS